MATEKGYVQYSFTLAAVIGTRSPLIESAGGKVLYFAEGAGIPPGGVSIEFDEDATTRVRAVVGDFIRIPGGFDKVRIINNLAAIASGLLLISADPDFLYLHYPRGI